MDFAARAIQDRLRYREVRSSLSSQESSANQSILMYHSTPSTPNTAPRPTPILDGFRWIVSALTCLQGSATLSLALSLALSLTILSRRAP